MYAHSQFKKYLKKHFHIYCMQNISSINTPILTLTLLDSYPKTKEPQSILVVRNNLFDKIQYTSVPPYGSIS